MTWRGSIIITQPNCQKKKTNFASRAKNGGKRLMNFGKTSQIIVDDKIKKFCKHIFGGSWLSRRRSKLYMLATFINIRRGVSFDFFQSKQ